MFNDTARMLDANMERSIATKAAAGVPGAQQDLGAWQRANDQYKRFKVLQEIAKRPGEVTARGYTTPAAVERAAKSVYGDIPYITGKTPFSAIGNAGAQVMKALADSGSSQRIRVDQAIHDITNMITGTVLGGGGGVTHGVEGLTAGLVAGHVYGPAISRLVEPGVRSTMTGTLMNPVVQRYLGNQLLTGRNRAAYKSVPGLLTQYENVREANR
jgi:hypothetical protein